MNTKPFRRLTPALPAAGVILAASGCFSERSFPLHDGDLVRMRTVTQADDPKTTRAWLREAHSQLKHLLPRGAPSALLSEDLLDGQGRPVDVLKHFNIQRDTLETLAGNCQGLEDSAQLTGSDFSRDLPPPKWPGCEDVWIPINAKLSLHGLLGIARDVDGHPLDSDCIVLLPGLLGHNGAFRTRDLTAALLRNGLHVLAVELRGHGQTDVKYPDVYYTFGALEIGDLMVVAEWLQNRPHIRRTGLVGYCSGANEALLAAWYDGRSESHPSIAPRLAPFLRPVSAARHYEAGAIAFSPVLRFEEIIKAMDPERSVFFNPVLASLQETVQTRVREKAHDRYPGFDRRAYIGSLRKLIDYEYGRSEISYPGSAQDGMRLLRFLPYEGLPCGDQLASARVPVLIVQAANDPLACAQDVAELIARTPNPNVAAVVLSGGGHVGFAAFARAYYYSLILNFFSSQSGPRAVPPSGSTATASIHIQHGASE